MFDIHYSKKSCNISSNLFGSVLPAVLLRQAGLVQLMRKSGDRGNRALKRKRYLGYDF